MRRALLLCILFFSQQSWGWGTLGHMVVAQVAENNLTPKARAAVKEILKGKSLADVSNWADFIKSKKEWAHTKSWHFVDIPDGEDYTTIEHHHEGDTITAMTEMVEVLKRNNADAVSKEDALKFVIHFAGDIHQPLHVGKPEDRGGNDVRVVYEGRNSNLHQLWDSLMIMKSPMNHIEYADWLEQRKDYNPPYDLPSFAFSVIIDEAMEARSEIYQFSPKALAPIQISRAYYERNVDLMNRQLLRGGQRLAELLNSIYR